MSRNPDNHKLDGDLWKRYRAASRRYRAIACPDANTLAAYIEGNLPVSQLPVMEAHLASCSACLETVVALRTWLKAPPLPAPERLVLRAKALVPRADKKRRVGFQLPDWLAGWLLLRRPVQWASVAAAVTVACILGFNIGQDMYANAHAIGVMVSAELSFGLGEPPNGPFVIEGGDFPATGDPW